MQKLSFNQILKPKALQSALSVFILNKKTDKKHNSIVENLLPGTFVVP